MYPDFKYDPGKKKEGQAKNTSSKEKRKDRKSYMIAAANVSTVLLIVIGKGNKPQRRKTIAVRLWFRTAPWPSLVVKVLL